MNSLSSFISKISTESTEFSSKISKNLTDIQAKTEQIAKAAFLYVKTSFERVGNGLAAGFSEFKGKLENRPSKADMVFKNSTENIKPKESTPSGSSDIRATKINQEMKQFEAEKALTKLTTDLDKKIGDIQSKPSKSVDDKEKLERLQLMQGKLALDPGFFLSKMEQYGHGKSALYTHLQPVEFLSILVKSDQNVGILEHVQPGHGNPSGLSEEERVALHHYTTNAYSEINQAGREAKLKGTQIQDPGMRACFEFTRAALKKLPDAAAFDKEGNQVTLKRSYFPPPANPDPAKSKAAEEKFQSFAEKTFVEGKTFNDGAFLSTSIKTGMDGAYNVYFEIPEGSKTIPGGKKIGFPYSAFSGVNRPDEGEVLFSPDVSFKISKVEGSRVTFQFM